jgi:hypothetical protein
MFIFILINNSFSIYFETLPRPYLTLKLFVGLGNDSSNTMQKKHHSKVSFDISLNKRFLSPFNLEY